MKSNHEGDPQDAVSYNHKANPESESISDLGRFFEADGGFAELSSEFWLQHFPVDDPPTWIDDYVWVHIAMQRHPPVKDPLHREDPQSEGFLQLGAVHELYHNEFENEQDRVDMVYALAQCHTLAFIHKISKSDRLQAAAAISFLDLNQYHSNTGVVVYIAVEQTHRGGGFGTFLLDMMAKQMSKSTEHSSSILLKANTVVNTNPMKFYTARGFQVLARTRKPVKALRQVREVTKAYDRFLNLGQDDGVAWLYLKKASEMNRSPADQEWTILNPKVLIHPTRGLVTVCPATYCRFPSGITFEEAHAINEGLVLFEQPVFFAENSLCYQSEAGVIRIHPGLSNPVRVSGRDRMMLRSDRHLPISVVEMVLTWLSRDIAALFWKSQATLVPLEILMNAHQMQRLLRNFLTAKTLKERNPTDERVQNVFHDDFDNARFLHHASVVLSYLLLTPDLFKKPFLIAMFQEQDLGWSCAASINANEIVRGGQPIKGSKVCGFVNFDPSAGDAVFNASPLPPGNPFLFLLSIAHEVHHGDHCREIMAKEYFGCRLNADTMNILDFFPCTADFCSFYDAIQHNFGEKVTPETRDGFNGDANFVQLELPQFFPLRCKAEDVRHSSLLCLLFLIDFCVSMDKKAFLWQTKGSVKMKPTKVDSSHFSIPDHFNLGIFLKQQLNIRSSKAKKWKDASRDMYSHVCQEALILCLNTVVVLVDRLLWIDPAHVKFSSGYEYFKTLNPNKESDDNSDFAQSHPDGQLILNQSFVFAWIPFSQRKIVSEEGKTSSSSLGSHTSPWCGSNADSDPNDLNSDNSRSDADAAGSDSEGSVIITRAKRRLGRPKRGDGESSDGSSHGDRGVTRRGRESIGKVKISATPRFREMHTDENAPPTEELKIGVPPKKKARGGGSRGDEAARTFGDDKAPITRCVSGLDCVFSPLVKITEAQHHAKEAKLCSRCKYLCHVACMRVRSNRLLCMPCFRQAKLNSTFARHCGGEPSVRDHLSLPDLLVGVSKPDFEVLSWEIQDAEWEMDGVIEEEMLHLGFKTWADMNKLIDVQKKREQMASGTWGRMSATEQRKLTDAKKALKRSCQNWRIAYKAFKKKFLANTHSFIPDLKYNKASKRFVGRAEWVQKVRHPNGNIEEVVNQQEIPLDKEFVEEHFPADVLQYVQRATVMSDKFVPVPRVNICLDTRVITHLKFCTSNIYPEGRYIVKYADFDEEPLEFEVVQSLFPSEFIAIVVKFACKGFFHIPPGAAKDEAGDHLVVNLDCEKLPIRFHQHNKNTCVLSSLASALWSVGLHGIAFRVADMVKHSEGDPLILPKVARFMSANFWLQPVRIGKHTTPLPFSLLNANLKSSIALVVLAACDGSRHHAVTVHDGFIFDSNEKTALLLCQENLDYLCSTEERPSKYKGVTAGYIFQEQGKRDRLSKIKASLLGSPWGV